MARKGHRPGSRRRGAWVPAALALLCGLAGAGVASAQTTIVNAPTPTDATPQSLVLLPDTGLNLDLGLGARARPQHLGSSDYKLEAVPVIEGQWGKNLHFSLDDGIQYTALRWDRLQLGPDIEYRQAYDDRLPARTSRTANAVETGAFAKVDLTYAELDMRVRKALNGYEGYSADATLDTLFPVIGRTWFVALEARGGWADRRFALNTFGRAPLPGQPEVTSIGDYYSAGAQVALIYLWRPRTKFILAVSDDQILHPSVKIANTNTRNAAVLLLAFTHRFSWRR